MVKLITSLSVLFLLPYLSYSAALQFVSPPAMSKDGSAWKVTFELNRTSDVEVSIVNPVDSTVVRHLAAGMLGTNPPPPLTAGSAAQTIFWDGKDDFGKTVSQPEALTVRVRSGLGVKLTGIAGEDMYSIDGGTGGLVLGDNGSVIVLGTRLFGHGPRSFIREYSASGIYVRTLYPPPASLPADSVSAYSINLCNSAWSPRTGNIESAPQITNTLASNGGVLSPIGLPGQMVLTMGNDMQIMSTNGAVYPTRKIINSPAAPTGYSMMGPSYMIASEDSSYFYLSGRYFGQVNMGSWLTNALTTGFWADGQVFRVNRKTGVVSQWLLIDSVPVTSAERATKIGGGTNAVAAIHGVAVDGKGHVFVCDRVNKRIGVYDTNSTPTLIASIPCVNPDYIAISKRTGVIYVITRSASAMSLVKFTGWETPGPSVATTQLTTSISTYTGSPSMVLSENGNTTLIWCAYKGFGLRQYSDNGTSFLLVNDLSKTSSVPYVFNNIAVDRKSETAFLLDSWGAVHSIRNWDNPFFARCSTTGAPLKLADMAIGPNSMIYGRYTGGGDNTVGAVQRYRIGSIYAAVPYGNTGSNSATTLLKDEWGTGLKDKGFAAGWQGQLGYITDANYTSGDDNAVFTCPDTGFSGGTPPAAIVKGLGGHCGGLKFDPSGNVYIGTSLRPADWLTNGCYSSDWFYTNRSGSIVKYAPGATGTVSSTSATGAAKVYPQHYGTFAGTGGSVCICRSPRFDVDPYGRLYVPDGAVQSIAIADNAGNTILSFGGYGNVDSRGDLGGGVAGPSIPLGFPTGIATSEDYIYVNDFVNARMLRVKMDYALDNMPGLTLHPTTSERVVTADPLSLSASPNPFTPISNIRVVLPSASDVHLAVYDVSGRLVRELNSSRLNKGVHTFFWRGENTNGQRVSAGLYVYRLTTNNSILTVKALMSR